MLGGMMSDPRSVSEVAWLTPEELHVTRIFPLLLGMTKMLPWATSSGPARSIMPLDSQ